MQSSLTDGPTSRGFNAKLLCRSAIGVLMLIGCCDLSAVSASQQSRRQVPQASTARIASATGSLKVTTGHAGSVVFINGVRHGSTNDHGELDLPHVFAGSFPVNVRTTGYADWNGLVVIVAHGSRSLKVAQQPISDEATLHFQRGNDLRDKGKSKDSVEGYR